MAIYYESGIFNFFGSIELRQPQKNLGVLRRVM